MTSEKINSLGRNFYSRLRTTYQLRPSGSQEFKGIAKGNMKKLPELLLDHPQKYIIKELTIITVSRIQISKVLFLFVLRVLL